MTQKLGPGTIEIEGERYATETFEYDGTRYTVRELSADEGDEIYDASKDAKGEFNGRLNTRMLLSKGLVEPVTTIDGIGKFGSRKYSMVLRNWNKVNTLDEANPTPPAGSAEPTPPAGGEPSPAS
jgi:hypothetical protein